VSLIDNLTSECSVKRPRYAHDSLGGDKPTYDTLTTELACWPQPASQSEITEFAKRDEHITHKVYFAGKPSFTYNSATHNLQVGDILVMTSGEFSGSEFEYRSADDASAGLGVLFKAMCEKIR
jgi:hypothetical protein